jgi:transposase-like protein
MKAFHAKLTPKQEQAIVSLLSSPTLEAAAQAVGVNAVTLWRWMQEAAFRDAYQAARRDCIDTAVGLLQKASGSAVGVLIQIMADKDKPASARISAARSILEYSFKGAELLDLETRLAALEEAAEGKKP